MTTENQRLTAFAPCRLAFAGGGTDLPAYAARYGGAVLSVAVSLGARVQVRPLDIRRLSLLLDDFELRADYADAVEAAADARPEVALVTRTLAEVRPAGGVEMIVRTGLPPGSGLGTSGAVGVATTYALHRLAGREPSLEEVAETASVVEIEKVGRPIGRQDQYAAAFGGLNFFHFADGAVDREAVTLPAAKLRDFRRHFMLFFSGQRRDSAAVLTDQRARIVDGDEQTLARLHRMKELAGEMRAALAAYDWRRFGELMHEAWLAKREVSPKVADEATAARCDGARERGAWAVKVTGAGAGGFYLAMAPPAAHDAVASYLAGEGFTPYEFEFDGAGVRLVAEELD
jgi:D-glycero-alpha-D-manno-heptose-7-phosphate kinase